MSNNQAFNKDQEYSAINVGFQPQQYQSTQPPPYSLAAKRVEPPNLNSKFVLDRVNTHKSI